MTDSKSLDDVCRLIFTAVASCLLTPSAPASGNNLRHRIHSVTDNGRFVALNIHRSLERDAVFEDGQFAGVTEQGR